MINSQQNVSGVNTVDAPAATTDGDNYVLAWTTSNQSIWWTTCPATNGQNSYDWVKASSVPNAASSGGPALVNFNDKVLMAWKGEGTDSRIFLSSLTGSTWSPNVPISGIGTSASPALTVTAKELYLVWKGEHDNTLYWSKSSDGKTWSATAKLPGAATSDSPALTGFKGVVYLAFKGESDSKMWLSQYSDDKGWGKATALPSDFETSRGPALGVGNTGNLHLVWKGASDNFVWESVLNLGKTTWSGHAKIVAIATSARPALASQTSTKTDILLAWKGATSTDLWVAPLDNLHKLIPLPPGAMPLPTDVSLTFVYPYNLQPPASVSGANDNVGFGSWATQAAVAISLVLSVDGTTVWSGWYQDQGNIPVFPAPAQNYHAVYVALAANKVAYTFSNSSGNPVRTGGAVSKWDVSQKSDAIAKNWSNLQAKTRGGIPQARGYGSCTNSSDLGSFLNSIIADIKELVGWVEDAVEVVGVIASVAA